MHTPTHTKRLALLLFCALFANFGVPSQSHAQDGWTLPHANAENTGRVSGQGAIQNPAVTYALTTSSTVADPRFAIYAPSEGQQPDIIQVVSSTVIRKRPNGGVVWDTPALPVSRIVSIADFNGDGQEDILALGTELVLIDINTGQPLWSSEDGTTLRNPTVTLFPSDDGEPPRILLTSTRNERLRLYNLAQSPEPLWSNSSEAFSSNWLYPIEADTDGNPNTRELVAVGPQCVLQTISLDTGALLSQTPAMPDAPVYCFGSLQAVDIDGVPGDEIVVTGETGTNQGLVGAFAYNPTTEQYLWNLTYTIGSTETRAEFEPNAMVDLDGDGTLEFVASVYNNTDQDDDGVQAPNTWSVSVYNGQTGALIGSLHDRILLGTTPSENNERALLTRATVPNSRTQPQFNAVYTYALRNNALLQIDTLTNAQPSTTLFRNTNRQRTFSDVNVLAVGPNNTGFLAVVGPANAPELQHISYAGGAREVLASLSLPLQVTTSTLFFTHPGNRLALRDNAGTIRILGDDLTLLVEDTYRGSPSRFLGFSRDGSSTLLHTTSLGLFATNDYPFDTPSAFFGSRSAPLFITLDRENDGVPEVFTSTTDQEGALFIQLARLSGSTLWRTNITQTTSNAFSPVRGQFGGSPSTDLAVLVNRSNGTQLAMTFNGDNGALISEHVVDDTQAGRFPNRALVATNDLDNDGTQELVHVHQTTIQVLRGSDLTVLYGPHTFPSGTRRPTSYSLFQADDDPNMELYLSNQFGDKIVMDIVTGDVQWGTTPAEWNTGNVLPEHGFADSNNDGVWDVALPGRRADLRVLDGRTGQELWGRCLLAETITPVAPGEDCNEAYTLSSIASADIDGDGVDEWIVGTSLGWLYAIDSASGNLDWSIRLRFAVRSPQVFDADGDGALEVVASTFNSELVTIDDAALDATREVREVVVIPPGILLNTTEDIDQQNSPNLLGVAWDPVEGAEGYLLSLFTEGNNLVAGAVDVGNTTSYIIRDLSLIQGQKYTVSITAYNGVGDLSPEAVSDGILITDETLELLNIQVAPSPFNPSMGETTTFSGQIQAASTLARVDVAIFDSTNREVFRSSVNPGASSFALSETWNGLQTESQEPLPDGTYNALIFARTLGGLANGQTLDVEIVSQGGGDDVGVDSGVDVVEDTSTPQDTGVDADSPDTGEDTSTPDVPQDTADPVAVDPPSTGDDGCCSCSTVPQPPTGGVAFGALFLGLLCWLRRRR